MADVFPNPLSGDATALEQDGTLYTETAEAIDEAIARIAALASGDFSSHAVTALHRNQGDVVKKMSRIKGRYAMAGGALVTYARTLRQAQADAARAAAYHGPLADQATTLQYRIQEATELAHQPGLDQPMHIVQLQQLVAELNQVQAGQADAERMWNEAKALKDGAARTARIAIHVGDEQNDLNDDLWDSLATIIPIVLLVDRIAQEVLKIVSLVLTILAIVFAVLSLIFPILSPVAAALFGYAQLVNLAVALLALLAFFLDGFHLMDLVLVGIAVVATFAAAGLGQVLGSAAQGAISQALAGIDEEAGDIAGAVAKNVISEGVKDFAKSEVGDLLFRGSDEAQQLFDEVGGPAVDGLNSLAAPEISALKTAAKDEAMQVGGYLRYGLDQTMIPQMLHLPFDQLSDFAKDGGLGNLDWAKDGWNAVQTHIIDPAHQLQQKGNDLLGQLTHWNPDGVLTNQDGSNANSPIGFGSGDVNGDKLGDAITGPANDWIGAASRGHWGGAAQWVVQHAGPPLVSTDSVTGAIGDRLGDIYGNAQDDESKNLVSYFAHRNDTWGPHDWDPDIWGKVAP